MSQKLYFKYDGTDLIENEIDANLLAESLNGLGDLIKETHKIVNGNDTEIQVKVKAFEGGCFQYLIDVIQDPTANIEVLSAIGLTGTATAASLMTWLERIKGQKIDTIALKQDGNCDITIDNETFEAPSYAKDLLQSKVIRRSFDALMHKPLQSDGIDNLVVTDLERKPLIEIDKATSKAYKFQRQPIKKVTSEKIITQANVDFLTIHKDKGQHWRISYQDEEYTVTIKDQDFLNQLMVGKEKELLSQSYSVTLIIKENNTTGAKTYIIDEVEGPVT